MHKVFLFGILFLAVDNVKGEKPCKEFISETVERTMKGFFACKTEMQFKSDEDKISKMTCILVCAMKKEKFLSPEGYVDESSLLTYVEHEIPKSVQSRAIELMLKCQEFGANIDPEEETCTSYRGLLKCALAVVFKVCN